MVHTIPWPAFGNYYTAGHRCSSLFSPPAKYDANRSMANIFWHSFIHSLTRQSVTYPYFLQTYISIGIGNCSFIFLVETVGILPTWTDVIERQEERECFNLWQCIFHAFQFMKRKLILLFLLSSPSTGSSSSSSSCAGMRRCSRIWFFHRFFFSFFFGILLNRLLSPRTDLIL